MTSPGTPVLFIHGLWLHATSWTDWVDLFTEAGYAAQAPGWPGDPDSVADARANPESIADHGIDDVVEHYAGIIEALPSKPILVGHSFGGNAISGTADRIPDKIKQLVYLDAAMLENGQTVFSLLPPDVVAARTKAAQDSSGGLSIPPPPAAAFGLSDPAQQAWLTARLTPHPFGTFNSPLNLKNKIANGLPATYIICSDPMYGPLQASREVVKKIGMKTVEIKTGHDAMVTLPEKLTDMLDADSV